MVLPTLTKRRNYYKIKIKIIRKNINKPKYFVRKKILNIFYIDSILISYNDWRFNELAAKSAQDMYLTNNPQITLFKAVYHRHTNFAKEVIEQNLTKQSNVDKSLIQLSLK